MVKNTPANAGDTIDREDPLEKEMATQSSILAREIPWTEEPDRGAWQATVQGVAELDVKEYACGSPLEKGKVLLQK